MQFKDGQMDALGFAGKKYFQKEESHEQINWWKHEGSYQSGSQTAQKRKARIDAAQTETGIFFSSLSEFDVGK